MNEEVLTPPEPVAPQAPIRNRKKLPWVIGGAVTAAALAISGMVLVPKLIHDARVKEYHSVSAEVRDSGASLALLDVQNVAAPQLLELHAVAAESLVTKAETIGATAEPVLLAKTAKQVADAAGGVELESFLPKKQAATPAATSATKTLSELVVELRAGAVADKKAHSEAEAALTKAKDAGEKLTKHEQTVAAAKKQAEASAAFVAPDLELSVEDAVKALGLEPEVRPVEVVSDDKVTPQVVEAAIKVRDETTAGVKAAKAQLAEVSAQEAELAAQLEPLVAPLTLAATEAPKQAEVVNAAAPKAAEATRVALTDAAKQASEKAKSATVSELVALVEGYVNAAAAVNASHAQVVADEAAAAAAAEAAAAGASGYTDPNTGGWVDTGWSGGGGSSWSGGGGSGGSSGGGWTGGGSSGGSGSGGGSTGGSGGTPASWFEANCQWGYNWSSAGGGTGYCYPAPDLDDDW